MYWFFRQTDRSTQLLHRAITDARAAGDTWTEGHSLAVLSMAQDSFDRTAAEQSARASLAVGRAASAPLLIGNGLLPLIGVVVHTEPERAIEIVEEMIDVARDAGDVWTEATGVRLKAHALSRAGELAAASRTYVEAIDLIGVGDFGELL